MDFEFFYFRTNGVGNSARSWGVRKQLTKITGILVHLFNFCLDGVRVQLAHRAAVPFLIVLVEVEGCVPQGGVHVDVLPHGLQHRVGRGVPVQVGLLLIYICQLGHGFRNCLVQPEEKD